MIENMVAWASEASTAWWVIGAAVTVIIAEAVRTSKDTLWGDMVEDDE